MINLGITSNFISLAVASKLRIVIELKEEPYLLRTVDGTKIDINNRVIYYEIEKLIIKILGGYTERIRFNIILYRRN